MSGGKRKRSTHRRRSCRPSFHPNHPKPASVEQQVRDAELAARIVSMFIPRLDPKETER